MCDQRAIFLDSLRKRRREKSQKVIFWETNVLNRRSPIVLFISEDLVFGVASSNNNCIVETKKKQGITPNFPSVISIFQSQTCIKSISEKKTRKAR